MKAAFVPEENELREDRGPWPREPLWAQLLRPTSAGTTPSLASEAHPGLVPTLCHGSHPGEEGRSPEGPVGALDMERETRSAGWEPSHTHPPAPGSLSQALPSSLPPCTHSQDVHLETWLGLRAKPVTDLSVSGTDLGAA